jgi:hypothetical protein
MTSQPYYAPEAACLWCKDCAPEDAWPTDTGETDSPNSCDSCGVLLDSSLTEDGQRYVSAALVEYVYGQLTEPAKYHGTVSVLDTWREELGSQLDDRAVALFDRMRERQS